MARCVMLGFFPACQAMTASTANSGSVCSQARMARANPCEMRNCAASAPQAITNAEKRIEGNVQSAEMGDVFGIIGLRRERHCNENDRQPAESTLQACPRRDSRERAVDRDRGAVDGRH